MSTTRKQQLDELKRELRLRMQVYPKWVKAGRLKQEEMEYRIRCLTDVISDFNARHGPDEQQGKLGI